MSNIYDKDVIPEIKLRVEVVTSHINTRGNSKKKSIKEDQIRELEGTHSYREHQRYGTLFPKKLSVRQMCIRLKIVWIGIGKTNP